MILTGDVLEQLKSLPDESVNCVVTSPPYWGLRDYGQEGQLGLEPTPEEYVSKMVEVFREVRRVLTTDGTCWLNIGDSYFSSTKGTQGAKPKDLVGIPWRLAFALQADGWCLRQDIIWAKPNPMPESVTDRCTKSHEYVFLLSKSSSYYYDNQAIKEVGTGKSGTWSKKTHEARIGHGAFRKEYTPPADGLRNKRDVWFIPTKPFNGAHFAVMPEALVEPCILAGCPEGGVVLDPFFGSGTVGVVAIKHNRKYIGIELNPEYVEIAKDRLGMFSETP